MIVLNGAEVRLIWMPAWEKLDFSACISWLVTTSPLPNSSEKLSWVPAADARAALARRRCPARCRSHAVGLDLQP